MKTKVLGSAVGLVVLAAGGLGVAQVQTAPERHAADSTVCREIGPKSHVAVGVDDVRWQPAPPALPAGAQVAVLEGDPASPGPFTMRLRVPSGYQVAPHWHPNVEHLTVLSGQFHMGMGERADRSKARAYGPGDFAAMPARQPHYVFTTEETTVQVHGFGPWGLVYVDRADDPRGKAPTR